MRILFNNGIINYANVFAVYLDGDNDLIFDLGSYNLVVYHDKTNTTEALKKIAQAVASKRDYIELEGDING